MSANARERARILGTRDWTLVAWPRRCLTAPSLDIFPAEGDRSVRYAPTPMILRYVRRVTAVLAARRPLHTVHVRLLFHPTAAWLLFLGGHGIVAERRGG